MFVNINCGMLVWACVGVVVSSLFGEIEVISQFSFSLVVWRLLLSHFSLVERVLLPSYVSRFPFGLPCLLGDSFLSFVLFGVQGGL